MYTGSTANVPEFYWLKNGHMEQVIRPIEKILKNIVTTSLIVRQVSFPTHQKLVWSHEQIKSYFLITKSVLNLVSLVLFNSYYRIIRKR